LLLYFFVPYVQKTMLDSTEKIIENNLNNVRKIQQNTISPPQEQLKTKHSQPSGCVIFKESCNCYNKFSSRLETTQEECRKYVKDGIY
ncbi:hypothetical protein, partial [Solimicrobium silvestre]|uniref:hypothetical protein n=1 Tax=Solimicrobium silvestre TaxID=2099400 RepID=UPI001A9C8255